MNGKQIGKKSVRFENPPCIIGCAAVAGDKEGRGNFGRYYDIVEEDPLFGGNSWEEAESKMQHMATEIALRKAGLDSTEVRYLIAGDLLGQLIATSFGILNFNIPMFGVYGACSTMGESMAIGSMLVDGGYAECLCDWNYNGHDYGLWHQGFHEYGSMHGTCGGRCGAVEHERLWCGPRVL